MAIVDTTASPAQAAIDHYLCSKKHDGRPISTREAVQALRAAQIKCYLSDRELAEMVAATAIGYGRDVTFDWTDTDE